MNQFTIQELVNRPEIVVHHNEDWSQIRFVIDGVREYGPTSIDSVGYGWLGRDFPDLPPLLIGTITAYIVRTFMRERIIERVMEVR